MTNDELGRTLDELHQQLQENPTLDEPTLASLRKLLADINNVLDSEAEPPEGQSDIRQQLRETIEQFEGEHPKLTVALSQISEFLANIGI